MRSIQVSTKSSTITTLDFQMYIFITGCFFPKWIKWQKKGKKKKRVNFIWHNQEKKKLISLHTLISPLCVSMLSLRGCRLGVDMSTEFLLSWKVRHFHLLPIPFVLPSEQRSFSYQASPLFALLSLAARAPSPTFLPFSCLCWLPSHPPCQQACLFVPTALRSCAARAQLSFSHGGTWVAWSPTDSRQGGSGKREPSHASRKH